MLNVKLHKTKKVLNKVEYVWDQVSLVMPVKEDIIKREPVQNLGNLKNRGRKKYKKIFNSVV